MSLYLFPTQNFQFINHSGPPKPKLTWRREHTKTTRLKNMIISNLTKVQVPGLLLRRAELRHSIWYLVGIPEAYVHSRVL
jgi:hypothetical protein